LKPFPLLVIRGEHSDLLSAETVQAMRERHTRLTEITVPGQGHAPALDGDLSRVIEQFITEVEAST
jgi:pimeloyl-ACP methyl ester carboxylesterase